MTQTYKIAVLAGDGIGPEITEQALRVLKLIESKRDVKFDCEEAEFGASAYFSTGKSFPDATILAVAHRLDTVIEHDYILVLGSGKVLEFGSPGQLLRSNGPFRKMVEDTGDIMSQDLLQRAFAKEQASLSC